MSSYDLIVIGGGINGCGIARDAAGRGYGVMLAEMNDLASGTSSGSTKLVHGGLRYLEHYEFRLVREALIEREILWANAPHIIWPLRFVLPHHKGLRPAWLLRLGLFLYDHLGGRKLLPPTRTLDLRKDPAGAPLREGFSRAFEYSDCWVIDSRLVVLNAMDAAERGARIRTRTAVRSARREDDRWHVEFEDLRTGAREVATARMLVNAAGPWVDSVLGGVVGRNGAHNVRLVQGSHIVVPKIFEHDRAYFFQNADGRIIFAIPYEHDTTLIGTTDRDYTGDPEDVAATDEEIGYLCAAASEYFRVPIRPEDVVWTYSAVRPLYDDGASAAQEATRDYVLKTDTAAGVPLLSVFGGKITTYRRLAESALEKIEAELGARGTAWTAKAPLPGGEFAPTGYEAEVSRLLADHPFLPEALARRLVRFYGRRTWAMLSGRDSLAALGEHFGEGLHAAEVDYLLAAEFAETAEDILWRRTRLGLHGEAVNRVALEHYLSGSRQSAREER
ncbi:glycerol-3-phosphate dehydrogenase [Arsenicitalea aurantiaca]|uniref:Glycerol-3-phosphate dehydrogenase n=1 Tax=Arsenicitalea aurantiaca TaxID=1783274 RepID=A0A433XAE0_9HYPH|nr:glycerol-3-phosphate dehydrogenase [Arsenicitalea aurantiaca]RUT31046.1 glycerol-3-phosphate dehydrogenase [Arsenicitalea aurantiaca]